MNRIWYHLSSVMAVALLSSSAPAIAFGAEMAVEVRGGVHDGYTRLVFEADKAPQYKVSGDKTHLTLTFPGATSFKAEGGPPDKLPRIESWKVLPDHAVEISFPQNMTVRHFTVDNRVIVDVRGIVVDESAKDEKGPAKKEEKQKAEKAGEEKPVDLTPAAMKTPAEEKTPVKNIPEKETSPKEENKNTNNKTPEEQDVEKKIGEKPELAGHVIVGGAEQNGEPEQEPPTLQALAPHQITIAGTSAFALAVFEKDNRIWVVMDRPDAVVPPQIEGPDRKKLPLFEKVMDSSLNDVTVFRAQKPEGYRLSGGGGGLVWKIDMTADGEEKFKPSPLKRAADPEAGQELDGPSLAWLAATLHRTTKITDPDTGETIWLGLVDTAQDFSGKAQRFSELQTLPSIVGLALVSKVDDLEVKKDANGATISRPGGLALSPLKDMVAYNVSADDGEKEDAQHADTQSGRIYDFESWKSGNDYKSLIDNQRLILSGLNEQTDQKKTEGMISLGRMMLSHGWAPEARGYFDLVLRNTPDLGKTSEYQALRGAAEALSGHFNEAFRDFSNPVLDGIPEIGIWKAFALSGLDDWQQAAKTLPNDVSLLNDYPREILYPVGLRLAEVALREGNIAKAGSLLDIIDGKNIADMPLAYRSALTYLKGELARQKGKKEDAKELWSTLENGADDLYRVKSKLALTGMRYRDKEITIDKAIDTLEGLRYAWRGDELETSVNFNLGKLYLEKGEPVRALGLMRRAAGLIPNSEQGKMISSVMHATFQDLYMTDKIQKLSPIEALTMYDEFSDLVPKGAEGDRLARQLAERLADVDMLPRAINLLKQQVDTRLAGLEGSTVAVRLASLQLLDNKEKDALASLDRAEQFLASLPSDQADPKRRQIALIRAKALAQMGQPQKAFDALSLLSQDEDVLRLRADIAWKAKKWQDAADALEQIIAKQDISLTRPLTDEQAKLVLDWALALYLADNRYVLANLRERYGDLMSQTSRAREFEVITRPRQNILLADRDTIQGIIGETDIFKDFLQSLKEDLTGPVAEKDESALQKRNTAKKDNKPPAKTAPVKIPEELKNAPQLKTDEVLAD